MSERKILLIEGIDTEFFNLLDALYKPFLSASHLKDKYKYTIYDSNIRYPIGIISINKGKNTFMQFAVIPEMQGKGIAHIALDKIINISNIKKVGWGCKKSNYPSLKHLYNRKGGLYDNVLKDKRRKSYEGYFRVEKPVSSNMLQNLESVLNTSKADFNDWLVEYGKRKHEEKKLMEYLSKHEK